MNIQELLNDNSTINITVSGKDLQEYGQEIAKAAAEIILQRNAEKLLTAAEVEAMFDICSATRWRWDKIGLLKAKRMGHRIYYPESSIKELLKKKGGNNE